jgi:hypothetical protein
LVPMSVSLAAMHTSGQAATLDGSFVERAYNLALPTASGPISNEQTAKQCGLANDGLGCQQPAARCLGCGLRLRRSAVTAAAGPFEATNTDQVRRVALLPKQ